MWRMLTISVILSSTTRVKLKQKEIFGDLFKKLMHRVRLDCSDNVVHARLEKDGNSSLKTLSHHTQMRNLYLHFKFYKMSVKIMYFIHYDKNV